MCVEEMKTATEMAKEMVENMGNNPAQIVLPLAKAFTSALETLSKKTDKKMQEQAKFCMEKWELLQKSNKELQKNTDELRADFVKFQAESSADRAATRRTVEDMAKRFERLENKFSNYIVKASKGKALLDFLDACFGTMKDTVKTLLIIGFVFGAVHVQDIIKIIELIINKGV